MQRVEIIPSHRRTLFGPQITIYLKNGQSFTKSATGKEFIWNFSTFKNRLQKIVSGIPIHERQYDELVTVCSGLENVEMATKLIELTILPDLRSVWIEKTQFVISFPTRYADKFNTGKY